MEFLLKIVGPRTTVEALIDKSNLLTREAKKQDKGCFICDGVLVSLLSN